MGGGGALLTVLGRRSVGASEPAPNISYAGSPYTWYDYFTSVNLSVSNSGGSVTSYAVQSGTLPAGVSLNTGTGAITGTPTALKSAGNVTIRATGPGGTSDATVNITVAWFPSSISGLVAGYDTEAGFSSLWQDSARTTAAGDTDPCGAMDDLSGNGNHVIQATSANKPTVAATGLNIKRCITFDGGDYLTKVPYAGGSETQPNTVVAIGLHGANGAAYQVFVDGDISGAARNGVWQNVAGNYEAFAGSLADTGDAADTALHLHVVLFNGASSEYFLDGTSISTANPGAQDMGGVSIGGTAGGGALLPSGSKIAVVIVYGADIGATARANLKTWAVAKWGTPA